VELTSPWQAIEEAGGSPQLVSPADATVQAFNQDVEKGATFPVDVRLSDASVEMYDALVLPGGTTNPDALRLDRAAVEFVGAFVAAGKPVAAICHGPWTLVEADVVRGKTLTSWPSVATDIRNAGGTWRDDEVFVCDANGWQLVTSRGPDDLEAFNRELVRTFGGGSR